MIVVDTNILCLRWLPADESAQVDTLLEREPIWGSALLWRWEFRNALTGYIRRRSLTTITATAICADAEESLSGYEFRAQPKDVFDLVVHSTCTAYDCEFVAVARELGVRLVTADRQILREFPHIAVSLGNFLAS